MNQSPEFAYSNKSLELELPRFGRQVLACGRGDAPVLLFIPNRALIVQGRMTTMRVVPPLDELKHRLFGFLTGSQSHPVDELALQGGEEGLTHRVVVRVAQRTKDAILSGAGQIVREVEQGQQFIERFSQCFTDRTFLRTTNSRRKSRPAAIAHDQVLGSDFLPGERDARRRSGEGSPWSEDYMSRNCWEEGEGAGSTTSDPSLRRDPRALGQDYREGGHRSPDSTPSRHSFVREVRNLQGRKRAGALQHRYHQDVLRPFEAVRC